MEPRENRLLGSGHRCADRAQFGLVAMARETLDGQGHEGAGPHAVAGRGILDFGGKLTPDTRDGDFGDVGMNARTNDLFDLHGKSSAHSQGSSTKARGVGQNPGDSGMPRGVIGCRATFGCEAD